MSIRYSGGTLINRVFVPSTRIDWCNAVTQALLDAGWTTVSGTPGAGSDVTQETPAQNSGASIRIRCLDPGGGNNCAQVTMRHPQGATADSSAIFCMPSAGSGVWRVIAGPYAFYAFAVGDANKTVARGNVAGGTLYTPSFMNVSGGGVGFLIGVGSADTDAVARASWRNSLRQLASPNIPRQSGIWGANLVEALNTPIMMTISTWQGGSGGGSGGDVAYRWDDNSYCIYEPLVSWSTGTSTGNEYRLKGQLYDAMIVAGSWNGEQVIQYDGHLWLSFTSVPTTGQGATACLYLAIS